MNDCFKINTGLSRKKMDKFFDRFEAGAILANHLKNFANNPNVIILALPRGGVPVAYAVANALSAPLDVFIVRKLGLPGYEELAMGAIASGGTVFFNEPLMHQLNLDRLAIQHVIEKEQEELQRREYLYRGGSPFPNLKGKIVILVDDGIATGATMKTAIETIRKHEAKSIVIAIPVAAYSTCEEIAPMVETLVCPLKPINFYAVSLWYQNFPQTSDNEVIELLKKSQSIYSPSRENLSHFTLDTEHSITIPSGNISLDGLLYLPKKAHGLVLFVHGSGSSRFSVRNQFVARILNKANLATLLFDLFTPSEDAIDSQTHQLRFDIKFLASRLIDATQWCRKQAQLNTLPIGYFGASTGGGAALVAAASAPNLIYAVVSRGGRPDLAGESLAYVLTPTLLIVGGFDEVVIQMNKEAMSQLNCIKKMEIVSGATHLFEEPGTLNEAAKLAKNWFVRYLK